MTLFDFMGTFVSGCVLVGVSVVCALGCPCFGVSWVMRFSCGIFGGASCWVYRKSVFCVGIVLKFLVGLASFMRNMGLILFSVFYCEVFFFLVWVCTLRV